MRLCLLLFCLTIGFISSVGCSTYQGERYTHRPTNTFAHAMVNWSYKRASNFIRKTDKDIIVIPRFREFSRDFTDSYAFVYFVSKQPNVEIKLKLVSISTTTRNAQNEIILESFKPKTDMLVSPIRKTKQSLDYPYSLISVFRPGSGVKASDWNHEDELIFTVTYSVNGGPEISEEFTMKKSAYTGIAWPT